LNFNEPSTISKKTHGFTRQRTFRIYKTQRLALRKEIKSMANSSTKGNQLTPTTSIINFVYYTINFVYCIIIFPFVNIKTLVLFTCLRMWLCIFYYINNMYINKLGIKIHTGTCRFTGCLGAVNVEVPKKRIINTKTGVPKSPGKTQVFRSLGSQRI
jgi:hypothetical protein